MSPEALENEAERVPLLLRVRRQLGRVRRSFAVDKFDVFARTVSAEDRTFLAPPDYAFRWATADEIAGCEVFHTELDERERALGVGRLELGHSAVAAFAGDRVVFTMWVNPRNINIPGDLKRRLHPHQSFIYKAYTSPDHRGRKLYQAGMRFVLAEMAAAGKTELIGYAHVKKTVSRKGLARLEFESRGRYWSIRLPGWKRTVASRTLVRAFPEEVARSGVLADRTLESSSA